jgi:hypothetical protein
MRQRAISNDQSFVPAERIERAILLIRGQKVMLDADLAEIYGVETKALNRAVKRNRERFPEDFMLQLTVQEASALRCQFGTSNIGRGGRRYLPYVFTEHGAIMAANVLNAKRAIAASVHVVRAFVRLRALIASNKDLARKLEELEKKYDSQFKVVFDAIRQLMAPSHPKPRKIGFRA